VQVAAVSRWHAFLQTPVGLYLFSGTSAFCKNHDAIERGPGGWFLMRGGSHFRNFNSIIEIIMADAKARGRKPAAGRQLHIPTC